METYSLLREIADSWGLLAMMIFFCAAVIMLFRPGAKQLHKDASQIPFRENPPKRKKHKKNTACSKLEQPLEGEA